jgi:hypothetical protein
MNSQSISGIACSRASNRIIQIAFDAVTVALWQTRPGNRGSCWLQSARARNSGGGPPRQHGGLRLLPDNWLETSQAVRITAVKALSSFQFCFPDCFRHRHEAVLANRIGCSIPVGTMGKFPALGYFLCHIVNSKNMDLN